MTSALQTTRKALAATLTALGLDAVTVLAFEPAAIPAGTTVTVALAGLDPTEHTLDIRVYVSDLQPGDSADILDDTVSAVDVALPPSSPRSDWRVELDEPRRTWIATTSVQIGREDF